MATYILIPYINNDYKPVDIPYTTRVHYNRKMAIQTAKRLVEHGIADEVDMQVTYESSGRERWWSITKEGIQEG